MFAVSVQFIATGSLGQSEQQEVIITLRDLHNIINRIKMFGRSPCHAFEARLGQPGERLAKRIPAVTQGRRRQEDIRLGER